MSPSPSDPGTPQTPGPRTDQYRGHHRERHWGHHRERHWGRRHRRGLTLPGTTLAFILGTLVLTYGLQDSARERDDRRAVAITALLHDQARAFDNFQHDKIMAEAILDPSILSRTTQFPSAADGVLTNPVAHWLQPYRHSVAHRDRRIALMSVPIPGEPGPLGVMIVTLAPDEERLLPRILAWLEARSALETKAWRGDVLPWLRDAGLVTDPDADFAFFTAPHAGINPDLVRRNPRAGWPDQPMATDLRFAGTARLCGAIDRSQTPPICSELARAETVVLQATTATVNAPLTTDGFATSTLTAGSATLRDLIAPSGSVARLSGTRGTINTATVTTLSVSSPPPSGGLAYAASFGSVQTPQLETPILAVEGRLTSATSITGRFLTADRIRRRDGASLPILGFTGLTTDEIASNSAQITTGSVTSCIGCP